MFTIPSSVGGLGTWRPTASTGTGAPFSNPSNAYDLPSSRDDDPPYTTYGDSGFITSTSSVGVTQNNDAEFNTFKNGIATSLPKSNFSQCELKIGVSINTIAVAIGFSGAGPYTNNYVTGNLAIQYQVDGTNWVTIKNYPARNAYGELTSPSALATYSGMAYHETIPADVISSVDRETVNIIIPSSSFSTNLNNLKVRFRVSTIKDASGSYSGTVSYKVWDIRANIS